MSESTEHEELVDETPGEDVVDGAPAEGADEENTAEAPAADPDGQRSRKDEREEELVAEGDIAADYLEELLDIVDMDGDIDTYTEGDRAHVAVVTEDETLVGRDGEVLEALQELSRLAVMTETGHRSRLMLDIAGHREKHRKELQLLAQDAINEVNETGEPVRLSSMNPFERKIVHDAVAAAGLFSESEGTEPQRRVVVQPAR
ncbi:R3H domain protein [Propionibacterium acidifaciens F0233]|mgnify:FL=1|uniref:R3H domain protein n=1 Tax=Propionibacterium acidifaciens F0233 TaxID=553198 RepID=U2Q2Y6_9ACTN|nr:R3H domain-containing nucleic acid-binding protein [Propionibacterium acidifaciens]AYW77768.1 protein jag [Propionibacterium acidifaciens]ERK50384.1 R3H domain protein [Propionibacterium acidifaciens F0233]